MNAQREEEELKAHIGEQPTCKEDPRIDQHVDDAHWPVNDVLNSHQVDTHNPGDESCKLVPIRVELAL